MRALLIAPLVMALLMSPALAAGSLAGKIQEVQASQQAETGVANDDATVEATETDEAEPATETRPAPEAAPAEDDTVVDDAADEADMAPAEVEATPAEEDAAPADEGNCTGR